MADDVEQGFQAATLAREMRSIRAQWAHHVFATAVLYLMVPFGALAVLSIYLSLIDLHNLAIALVETFAMCSVLVLYAKFTSEDFTGDWTLKRTLIASFIVWAVIHCTCSLSSPSYRSVGDYAVYVLLNSSDYFLVQFAQEVFGGRSRQFPTDWHNTAAIALCLGLTLIYLCVVRFVVITEGEQPALFTLINLIYKLINLKLHEN